MPGAGKAGRGRTRTVPAHDSVVVGGEAGSIPVEESRAGPQSSRKDEQGAKKRRPGGARRAREEAG